MPVQSAKLLNVLVVEDDSIQRKLTRRFLKNKCAETVGEISEASSVTDASALLRIKQFDLLLLDISIQGGKSFDILPDHAAHHHQLPYKIIFLTCHTDLAIQGYDYHAADFIAKPINYERLESAISRIAAEKLFSESRAEPTVELPCGSKKVRRIVLNDILYCRANGKFSTIVLANNEEVSVWLAFNELCRLLPSVLFSQIHRSYAVNKAHINSYSLRYRKAFVTVRNAHIPIGSAFLNMFSVA